MIIIEHTENEDIEENAASAEGTIQSYCKMLSAKAEAAHVETVVSQPSQSSYEMFLLSRKITIPYLQAAIYHSKKREIVDPVNGLTIKFKKSLKKAELVAYVLKCGDYNTAESFKRFFVENALDSKEKVTAFNQANHFR